MLDDERKLVLRAQSGDVAAFEALIAPHQDALFRLVLATTGDTDDAQDALQETLVHAFRNIGTYRGEASISTWLHRIALNCTRNWLRSQSRESVFRLGERLGNLCPPSAPDPSEQAQSRDLCRALAAAVATLPPAYRETLLLRYYTELPYDQIASALSIPIGTVRSRLAYARTLLLRHLQQAGYAPPDNRGDMP